MTKNDLKKYFSEIHFDSQRKTDILLNILDKNIYKEKRKHVRLRVLTVCAAVISVLLIITTAAVANRVAINDLLQKYLGIGDEKEIQSIEPDIQQYSCIDENVRVNILQTLSDNKTIYIIYEIVLPNNEVAISQRDPDALSFIIDGISNGAYVTKTLSISGNTIQNMIIYDTYEQITSQNKLTLCINKIFTEQRTIDGNWTINWNSNSESDNKLLNTNITLSKNNFFVTVNQIYLSPLSLSLNVQADDLSSLKDILPSVVLHTTQSEIHIDEVLDDKAIYYDKELKTGEIYYRFNQLITIEDIIGITIENQYISLTNVL